MARRRALGRSFGWLWGAYAVSAYGTGLGFGAFPLLAVLVLHAGPVAVSLLAAAGPAAGSILAIPLGPWVDRRRKRPVMIATDVLRFAVLMSVPAAYAVGALSFVQLLLVAVVTAVAKIVFNAASGAHLKALVAREDLVTASSRFESTTWSAMTVGPPLGGAAIGILGPVTTVVADAGSYLLSALGIVAIPTREPPVDRDPADRFRLADLLDGWRLLIAHPELRRLFVNTVLVNGLIMAGEPLMAVLMLGRLGFPPWQYGLAFAAPCLGGLVASRCAGRLVARYGSHRVLRVTGTLRACWPIGLAAVGPGPAGLTLVLTLQFGLVIACGLYNPVLAARRLELTPTRRTARMLTAWSITSSGAIAACTAAWGLVGAGLGPRAALALAGGLLLVTPLLLPRRPVPALTGDAIAA